MFKKFFLFFVFFYSNQLMPVNQRVVHNTQEFEEWKKEYLWDLAAVKLNNNKHLSDFPAIKTEYSNLKKLNIDSKEKQRRKDEIFTKLLEGIKKKYSLKENEHYLLQVYDSFVGWEKIMNESRKDFRGLM